MEVLGNVLDNAYKYGSTRLSVDASIHSGAPDNLCITIEDDGPGISEGQQEWVFQRGARLDTLAHGQGIGLAVVTDIVSSYGGKTAIGKSATGGARVQLIFSNFQRTVDNKTDI